MCLSTSVKTLNCKYRSNTDQVHSTNPVCLDKIQNNLYSSQSTQTSNKCFNFFKQLFCCKKKKSIVNNNSIEIQQLPKSPLNYTYIPKLQSETSQSVQLEIQQKLTVLTEINADKSLNTVNCSYADELLQLGVIPYQPSRTLKTEIFSNRNIKEVLQNFTSGCNLGYFNEKVLIASGGRSSVFYAKDCRINGKPIVLKQIQLTPEKHQSVFEEVSFLLNNQIEHENLLKANECFMVCSFGKQELYITMEYFHGGCLRQLLTTKLTEVQMATVVKEVLRGLAYMHSHVNNLHCYFSVY